MTELCIYRYQRENKIIKYKKYFYKNYKYLEYSYLHTRIQSCGISNPARMSILRQCEALDSIIYHHTILIEYFDN